MNNSRKIIFLILSICLATIVGKTQEIRGADMDFVHTSTLSYQINVDLYFSTNQEVDRPFITLFFGDGFQDTAWLNNQENIYLDIWKLSYDVEHEYLGAGNFSIWLLDSIPMPEVNNYDYQEGDLFLFYGDLLVHTTPIGQNGSPYFTNDQSDVSFNDGIWRHQMELENPDGENMLAGFTDFPYFAYPGFTLPNTTDTFSLDTATFEVVWDRPYQPGKYLLPIFVLDYLPTGPSSLIPLTKAHRFIIIDIKEEDIVASNISQSEPETYFSLSPNPANNGTVVQFFSYDQSQVQLNLLDVNGRSLRSYITFAKEGLNQKEIDLIGIPPGIYLLSLQTEKGNLKTKKIVVL